MTTPTLRPGLFFLLPPELYERIARGQTAIPSEAKDARDSIDGSGRRDDTGDRARHSSTLRFRLSLLPSEVGMGREQHDLLQLYIMGSVQGDRLGTVSHVLGKPVLVASPSRQPSDPCRPQGRT